MTMTMTTIETDEASASPASPPEVVELDGAGVIIPAEQLDLAKHNGRITVSNPATGKWRTLRVYTVLKGRFAGSRRIALLTDSDNESSYLDIAFMVAKGPRSGTWTMFPSKVGGENGARHSVYEILVGMLLKPVLWQSKGVEFRISGNCRRCNRPLTVPSSVDLGLGSVCAEKGM